MLECEEYVMLFCKLSRKLYFHLQTNEQRVIPKKVRLRQHHSFERSFISSFLAVVVSHRRLRIWLSIVIKAIALNLTRLYAHDIPQRLPRYCIKVEWSSIGPEYGKDYPSLLISSVYPSKSTVNIIVGRTTSSVSE